MMRRLAKTTLCRALSWARLERWIERGEPVVLAYHRVVEDDAAVDRVMPGLAVSVAMLERHLDWLGRHCRFVDLDDLAGPRRGKPAAAVTFDDGYADVLEHAVPLLVEKGIPAAIFVVSGAAPIGAPLLHDRLYRALAAAGRGRDDAYRATRRLLESLGPDRLDAIAGALEREAGSGGAEDPGARPLGWAELTRLQAAGFTIGSHSRTHALLAGLDAARLHAEVQGSRDEIEAALGVPVHCFAYPDGQFDAAAVAAVAAAGYRLAFTCCRHRDPAHPLLTIPRAALWERSSLDARGRFSGDVLACQTHGALALFDRCRREHLSA
jgi:peptidoglycan/xylan/chitin deacetylase (PgdA/CDA1 family)